MTNIVIGDSAERLLGELIERISSIDSFTSVTECRSAREVASLMRTQDVEAFVFPKEWAEVCRSLRLEPREDARKLPVFILAAHSPTKATYVKSLLFGFDGVLDTSEEPHHLAGHMSAIFDGTRHLIDEEALRNLNLRHGLFAREVLVDNADDLDLAQLVGAGLPDSEIAALLGWNIQQVRNRIEHLLTTNELSYRTQLAVLSSSVWRIPDFR